MKTIVIYHRADFDGIFCREIAKKFLPEDTMFIGWDYGDHTPVYDADVVYMLDISVAELMGLPNLIWIDHHKSAIEKYAADIRGYRIDGVAACRLAWQYFTCEHGPHNPHCHPVDYRLPEKMEYVERKVSEPWAVRLAGEYDVWDKRDSNAELFQHGLKGFNLKPMWDLILRLSMPPVDGKEDIADIVVGALLEAGRTLQYAKTQENESIIQAAGFTVEFEGLKFLACNHARYNSHLFTAGLRLEHDACLGFAWREGWWVISLYHAPGKEHHDLSKIAIKYGGGGHRGACGFRVGNTVMNALLESAQ